MARNRSRKRGKSSSKSVLWWVIGGLLAVMFLLIVAVGVVYFGFKPGGGSGKPLFDQGNTNVGEEGFAKIEDGMSKAELEALLGPSYQPDEKDFELLTYDQQRFGPERRDEFRIQQYMSQRQFYRVWSRGNVRIFVQFHKQPEAGGLCVTRILRDENGGITIISGNMQKILEKELIARLGGGQQKQQPGPPLPPGASNTTAVALHGEFVANAAAAKSKYFGQTVTITGTVKVKLPGAVFLQGSTDKGMISVNFDAEDGLKLQQKNVGDSMTFTGKFLGFNDINHLLAFDRSKFVN